ALLGIGEVSYRGSVVPAAAGVAGGGRAPVRRGAPGGPFFVHGSKAGGQSRRSG
ncbi:hypothetical protein I5K80_30210, partial [Pseudomonas aeruginosa]|nr:hypothetical protein [Pseudomonas aeruginosa]